MSSVGLKVFWVSLLSRGRKWAGMADFFKDVERKHDELKRRAWDGTEKKAGERFAMLDEAAALVAEIDGWQSMVESPTLDEKKRQLGNFTRLIGYRPSDLYRLVGEKKASAEAVDIVEPKRETDPVQAEPIAPNIEEVIAKVEPVAQMISKEQVEIKEPKRKLVTADDFEKEFQRLKDGARKGVRGEYVSLITEINQFEDAFARYYSRLNPRERKKWARTQAQLKGELRKRVEVGLVYGTAPDFDMTWVLRSDDDSREEVEGMVNSYPESARAKYVHLLDKSHPQHPSWFLFLHGAQMYKMTVIGQRMTNVVRGASQAQEHTHFVACSVLERTFENLPEHRAECMRTLVAFMKSDEFASKTKYKAVMLNGLVARFDDGFVKREGLMEFEVPKTISSPKKVIYGVKIPERGVSLGDIVRSSYTNLPQKP